MSSFLEPRTTSRRRRRNRRASSEFSIRSEDYSILEHPSDYPTGLIPTDTPPTAVGKQGRLLGGVIDGVPYFEEAKEMCESQPLDNDSEERTQMYSLNQG